MATPPHALVVDDDTVSRLVLAHMLRRAGWEVTEADDIGPAAELARNIRPDGTLPFLFDGLRVPVPLPPLAGAILGLVDGARTVGGIAVALRARGTDAAAFARAWRQTYDALSGVNRLLLSPPP